MYLWSCVKQDIEQFMCRALYFNSYLDRILLLSNCIGPKARGKRGHPNLNSVKERERSYWGQINKMLK